MSLVLGYLAGFDWKSIEYVPDIYFEDDGYYWHLHDVFAELHRATGQYIDLYGTAAFADTQIETLQSALLDARNAAIQQPDSWDVHVGNQTHPVKQPLYRTVNRDTLVSLINGVLDAATIARERDLTLAFWGD
ncbi:hypothetical protein RISK_004484 [Rhodopirellula islandica]|uniref:Uncharacterized protein n=1 Tax=Rhodopirellula islandica TaxID=595434 RepID=A0A0J1B9R0_RHOIS|nr:hypothetical protein [Rhodopirellula islandica]KLU03480.1 hypothetical protein RISK_004484 [Rhodopirellula islandica]